MLCWPKGRPWLAATLRGGPAFRERGKMAYYRDLRAFLDVLDARGKLYRFPEPIDKDTELLPLLRVQLRGVPAPERRVFLFESVRGAQGTAYDMRVAAGVYGVSEEVLALGLGCESPADLLERWHHATAHPVPPRLVPSGPVQEEVHVGDDLLRCGLDELPAPVEEPGFSQVIRTGLPTITRDPETGVPNVGTYNAFFRDRTRAVTGVGPRQHAMRYHWRTAARRGEDLPAAVVIGATPNVMAVGCARIAYGVDELAVAGGLAGEPVEVVRCQTVPLEVPAHAEIVIEGLISTKVFEPRLAFGEYPGYMNVELNNRPVLNVTAITHRHDAIFTPVLVGFPPGDTNALNSFVNAAQVYDGLRYGCGLPVAEVHFPQMGGGADFCIVRLEEDARVNAWQVLEAAAGQWGSNQTKYIVLVDHDINPRDPELLIWALTYRVQPERDMEVHRGRNAALDPAFGPTGSSRGQFSSAGSPRDHFRVLLDATLKGPYPPVALPRRDFMERALAIWRQHPDLPEPRLMPPWHGYTLGHWSEQDQELADLITRGDYRAVGRITAAMQVPATPVRD
jgi:4-hydroxy-3-polyprenylbenzoate decarboxylase